MASALLFLLAVVCSVIAALLGFDVFSGPHALGWAFLGAAFGWAGLLVAYLPPRP